MSNVGEAHAHAHHEHHETFVSKYIFSMDHKMIARQFLLTAVVMGIVGMMLSILFRLQLGWDGESFAILNTLLGEKWAPGGVLDKNMYLSFHFVFKLKLFFLHSLRFLLSNLKWVFKWSSQDKLRRCSRSIGEF